MARYRIGNDMTILWTVNGRDGSALPLKDKEVHLYYTCERGRFEAEFEIQGTNVVAWNFLGKNQRALGDYTLSLEILQSDGKRTIKMDKCNAFSLVGRNCEELYDNADADINEGGELTIVSNLDIYRISPIIPKIGENSNWHVDGIDTGRPSTGKSAYEYAKEKGYEGTEEEYAEDCRAIPEVKDQAQEAAEDIQAAIESFDKTLQGKQDTIEDLETIRSGAARGATAAQPSDIPKRLPNPLALNYSINGMSGVYTGEQSVYWPSIYAPTSSGAAGHVVEGGKTGVKWTKLSTINGKSLLNGEDIVIEENSKITLDFEKLGEPIESDEEGMEMRYSKEQFESAVGMSMSEFIEKIKTSELVFLVGGGSLTPYYTVADEYTWAGYCKLPGLFNYALVVDATPSEEKFFVDAYDESADLPFATTEYVDEKHAQTEAKITELSAEVNELGEAFVGNSTIIDSKLTELSVELGTANTPIVSTGTIADKRINDLKQTIDASGFKIHTYSVTREQYQTIDVLVPSGASQSSPHAGFYDANDEPIGTFVRTMNLRELTTLEVPDNAMTFKVSIYSFSANDLMVSGKSSDSIISTIEKINGIMQDHSQSLEEIKEVLGMETLVYSDNYANYGVLSSGKIVANSNINCRIVPVQKNEVVTTTAILKSVSYAAGFTTENLSGLSAEEVSAKGVVFDLFANDYSEQITIVAPSDGWMVFNIDKRSQTYVVSEDAVTKILGKIGDMKNLPTSAKADLVSAIGEVYNMALPAESVGNMSDLKTQDKSSIVAAINEVKSSVVLPEGTAYVGKATQVIAHEANQAELGAEMLSASGWSLGSGWSGDFNNGFNHSGANNGSLVFPLANLIADALYLLEISVTNANTQGFDSYRVRLGGSMTFATYNGGGNVTNRWILKAGAEDGNLEILSTETAWSGSVTSISLKPITNELTPFVQYRDKASIPTASITTPMSSQGSIYLGSDIKGAFLAKENVGVGKDALKDVLSGFWNVGVGYQALTSLQNGSRNVAIGFISQLYNVSGHRNISLGSFSLENLVDGHNNIAIGADSQQDNVSGEHNISIGTRSGVGIQGRNNIAIGANTLAALGDNPENIAIGMNAMAKVAGSNKMQNVVIGVNAMDNTSGAIGNTAIGYSAAQKVTGNYNVFLGYNAGKSIEYGIGNIIIGKGADHGKNKSFSIIIGYNVTGVNDNEIRIGSSTQTSVVIAGKVLTFNADGSVTWTTE